MLQTRVTFSMRSKRNMQWSERTYYEMRLIQAYQLTFAKRVRPAFEFQTRLTRTVAENPLEMADY